MKLLRNDMVIFILSLFLKRHCAVLFFCLLVFNAETSLSLRICFCYLFFMVDALPVFSQHRCKPNVDRGDIKFDYRVKSTDGMIHD